MVFWVILESALGNNKVKLRNVLDSLCFENLQRTNWVPCFLYRVVFRLMTTFQTNPTSCRTNLLCNTLSVGPLQGVSVDGVQTFVECLLYVWSAQLAWCADWYSSSTATLLVIRTSCTRELLKHLVNIYRPTYVLRPTQKCLDVGTKIKDEKSTINYLS